MHYQARILLFLDFCFFISHAPRNTPNIGTFFYYFSANTARARKYNLFFSNTNTEQFLFYFILLLPPQSN
jgi:hypothetical protein